MKNDNRKSKSWNAPDSIEIGRVTIRGCQLDETGIQSEWSQLSKYQTQNGRFYFFADFLFRIILGGCAQEVEKHEKN